MMATASALASPEPAASASASPLGVHYQRDAEQGVGCCGNWLILKISLVVSLDICWCSCGCECCAVEARACCNTVACNAED